jgi:hypothetical protein
MIQGARLGLKISRLPNSNANCTVTIIALKVELEVQRLLPSL